MTILTIDWDQKNFEYKVYDWKHRYSTGLIKFDMKKYLPSYIYWVKRLVMRKK